jgi:hypothetical protein
MRHYDNIEEIRYIDYTRLISSKIKNKKNSLQFLPEDLEYLKNSKHIFFNNQKLKSDYLIDIVHNMVLKYFFKKENGFVLNATILKKKYGHLYNFYISYLVEKGFIKMERNYKAGQKSRTYSLNPRFFRNRILRYNNQDKILLKKYKNKIIQTIDYDSVDLSPINLEVRQKLVSDLYTVGIDKERSMDFLNRLKRKDIDIYNRNSYSVESISDKHIFFHFDSYGRMHTNFTILRSFIRKNCLLIDGEETCEIDIKNSQPLFLCRLIEDTQTSWVKKEEFEFFKSLTLNGTYYEFMMTSLNVKDRKLVKEMTYKVLFGRNSSNSKIDKQFASIFPTIHNFIKLYKKDSGDYKSLSYDLQRAESRLIYNKVIKKMMVLYPDIKVITVHDSIVYPKKYKDEVSNLFNSEIQKEFGLVDVN